MLAPRLARISAGGVDQQLGRCRRLQHCRGAGCADFFSLLLPAVSLRGLLRLPQQKFCSNWYVVGIQHLSDARWAILVGELVFLPALRETGGSGRTKRPG